MTGHIPPHLPADGEPGQLTPEDRDALARSLLFAGCTEAQREQAAAFAHVTHVPHGGMLLQPGEPNHNVYVLVEGQLGAYLDANLDKMVARFVHGDSLGEHALIGPDGGTTYVSAQWPTRLVVLDGAKLRALMEQVPRIAINALDILSERLRAANLRHDPSDPDTDIEFMATHDALTGLHNRRWMATSYAAEITRSLRDGEPLCLVLVDVDHFHRMNDGLGRAGADSLLRHLADFIRNLLPALETVVRIANDRFAFLAPHNLAETLAMCERLRAQVAGRQFSLRGNITTRLTISIGVAAAVADFDTTLAQATAALERAKERGRNTVEPPLD